MSKMQKSKPKLIESPAVVSEKLPLFAALDLGTNSCRMLIARPRKSDFEVIDAFSKTVYLGKGMDSSGKLSNSAMKRTISALHVCQKKLISNEKDDNERFSINDSSLLKWVSSIAIF